MLTSTTEVRNRRPNGGFGSAWLAVFVAISAMSVPAAAQNLPDGPGKAQLTMVCTTCHGLDLVTSQKLPKASWKQTVDRMAARGASAKAADFDAIVEYLGKNFAQEESAAPAAGAAPGVLPEGDGKQAILRLCAACHVQDHFTRYRKTQDDWNSTVNRMSARTSGGSREDFKIITDYLIKNFPKVEDASKVNINRANVQQLQVLGFTSEESAEIFRYHQEHGDFRAWGEMLVIFGVDGRKIESLKDRMAF